MQETSIKGEVFAKLYDAIIDKANEVLEEAGLWEDGAERLHRGMTQKRLIGSAEYKRNDQRKIDNPDDRKRTIYAALYRFYSREAQSPLRDQLGLPQEALNPRVLTQACAQKNKLSKGQQTAIKIPQKYLLLYLAFLGYDSLADFTQEVLADTDAEGPERLFHYRCHYYSQRKQELQHFQGTFIGLLGEEKAVKVKFNGGQISSAFEGHIKVHEQEREAIITAWSTRDQQKGSQTRRPLIITITKRSATPFHLLKVCVGYYMSPSADQLENSCGIIIFEQLENRQAASQLKDHHLRHFLLHPPPSIPDGGFKTLQDYLHTYYQPYEEVTRLAERFSQRHYQAFLLSKKAHDTAGVPVEYVELSKFECYAPYRIRCTSNYATYTTFEGELEFFLPNRVCIRMTGQKDSHYQLLLEIPSEGVDSREPLRGVYSGMTQNGHIAAGRVVLIPVSLRTFEQLPINIYSPESAEVQQWVETYALDQFFAGEQDDFVDNSRVFRNQLTSIFEGSTDFSHLPGVYYYYRTRTIRGHMREIKRFPIILHPDGRVFVKIKSGGEYEEAHGTAIRIKECIYIHLKKKDRYDGLAILWPPSLRTVSPNDEIIPALYVSNSKRFHITAGRLFFIRQFEDLPDEALYKRLMPSNINLDDPADIAALNQKELVVTTNLTGQLNNYMAVRAATEWKLPHFADAIFAGACLQAQQAQFPVAFDTLYLALLRAGYRDIQALRAAFTEGGAFAGQEDDFRQYCRNRHDPIHGKDQRDYLEQLFTEIFPDA